MKAASHDLYVANANGENIQVFHRGSTMPYNVYVDPSGQYPRDVTIAKDGTLIASNLYGPRQAGGSISTWITGPKGGIFVGNFRMPNSSQGESVTVKKNGTVYYSDVDIPTNRGVVWSLSCPLGACGPPIQVAGVSFNRAGGMDIDNTGDLVIIDTYGLRVDTFELPNPNPFSFPLQLNHPTYMALNKLNYHLFVADYVNNVAAEYLYPSGVLVGTVPGSGRAFGIAVDP